MNTGIEECRQCPDTLCLISSRERHVIPLNSPELWYRGIDFPHLRSYRRDCDLRIKPSPEVSPTAPPLRR